MFTLTNACALAASAALSIALLAGPALRSSAPIPTHVPSVAALDRAVGDYRLDASLDAKTLPKGAIVTILRNGAGYALALPGATGVFASAAVQLVIETDQAGAPVLVLSTDDRSVRAHRVEARS